MLLKKRLETQNNIIFLLFEDFKACLRGFKLNYSSGRRDETKSFSIQFEWFLMLRNNIFLKCNF